MKTDHFVSVWDAAEDTTRKAASLQARVLSVTQPRVSDLLRGHVERFSLDARVDLLAAAGVRVEMQTSKVA